MCVGLLGVCLCGGLVMFTVSDICVCCACVSKCMYLNLCVQVCVSEGVFVRCCRCSGSLCLCMFVTGSGVCVLSGFCHRVDVVWVVYVGV